MKIDFDKVMLTDESRVILDGSDGRSKEWILDDWKVPSTKRRRQDGGGVMI